MTLNSPDHRVAVTPHWNFRRTLLLWLALTLVVGLGVTLPTTLFISTPATASLAAEDGAWQPGPMLDLGLTPLPALEPESALPITFPDGEGFLDASNLSREIRRIFHRHGLDYYGLQQDLDDLDLTHNGSRRHPQQDELVANTVGHYFPERLMTEATSDMNDLAILLFHSGTVGGDVTFDWGSDDLRSDMTMPVAALLFQRLHAANGRCESALNAYYTAFLSNSTTSVSPHLDAAHQQAAAACPGNPTPDWLAAIRPLMYSDWGEEGHNTALARERIRAMVAAHPRLALVGEALLEISEAATEYTPPFLRSTQARKAVRLVQRARVINDAPELMFLHAQLLLITNDHEAAAGILDGIPAQDAFSRRQLADMSADALRGAGRFNELEPFTEARLGGAHSFYLAPDGVGPDNFSRERLHVPSLINFGSREIQNVSDGPHGGMGGGQVSDLQILPVSRNNGPHPDPECRDVLVMWDLYLAGNSDRAVEVGSTSSCLVDGYWDDLWFGILLDTHGSVDAIHNLQFESSNPQLTAGDLQDVLRSVGQLERAREVTAVWRQAHPTSFEAIEMDGEIAWLMGDYQAAAELFDEAGKVLAANPLALEEFAPEALQLKVGVSLSRLGQVDEAQALFQKVLAAGTKAVDPDFEPYRQSVVISAASEACILEMDRSNWAAAADYCSQASQPWTEEIEVLHSMSGDIAFGRHPDLRGAQHNNLALSLTHLGRHDEAIAAAEIAVHLDPANPIFLETLAFAHHEAGSSVTSAEVYRQALAANPTVFSAWNNLGVLELEAGNHAGAVAAFRAALALRPGYAHAWHNLGVALVKQPGLPSYLEGQSALGRAALLDPGKRGTPLTPLIDREVYDSGIDLSRPIPPDWSLAAAEVSSTSMLTALTVLLATLLIGGTLLKVEVNNRVMGFLVRGAAGRGPLARLLGGRWPTALAVAALLVSQGVAAYWSRLPNLWHVAMLTVTIAGILAATFLVRAATRPAGSSMRHFAWPPFLAVALATTPFGLGFAPMPAAEVTRNGRVVSGNWARWSGTALMLGALVVFTTGSLVSGAPLLREIAIACFAMLASMLIPILPMDGAWLKHRAANLTIGILTGLVGLAFAMNWL